MRLRRRYVPLMVLLGAAAAVLPAIASSEALPVEAVNEGIYYHHWSNSAQTVAPGETVKFSNPGTTPHGLKFTGGTAGVVPSCVGIPAAATTETGETNWHAQCTFSAAGTYTFICTVHPNEMKGTVTVSAGGTTTTTTTTTPTGTTPTTPPEPSSGPPLLGPPTIHASQHGGAVKGALDISKFGTGDRLEVDVFAKGASLAKAGHTTRVRIGRLVRSSAPAGKLSFSVKLSAKARLALKRRGRLALTVKVLLTPSYGEPTTFTRSVVQHP
ncbi:MAG TPA: plastocyanin/azurin family copper-binding protein [Solirubrobacteraceae bacterium]|nr:plastocyanin/azurin family copper-binding protein [Solirubrobacteraceae bacterium]